MAGKEEAALAAEKSTRHQHPGQRIHVILAKTNACSKRNGTLSTVINGSVRPCVVCQSAMYTSPKHIP